MEKLIAGASALGLRLTDSQIGSFQAYYEELVDWNQKFNLTAITEYEQVQIRHFLDSLSCLLADETRQALSRPGARAIDVGAGAGFPGIPLKLACPGTRLTLLEATGKKAAFLEHLVQRLDLHRVTTIHARAKRQANRSKQSFYPLRRVPLQSPIVDEQNSLLVSGESSLVRLFTSTEKSMFYGSSPRHFPGGFFRL